jgi:hypothetical protein
MKKHTYRIKEVTFENGKSEFYPQRAEKVLEQRRSALNETETISVEVEGWVNLNKGGLHNKSYSEALEAIFIDREPKAETGEIIYNVY